MLGQIRHGSTLRSPHGRLAVVLAALVAFVGLGPIPAEATAAPSCVLRSSWSDFPFKYAAGTNTCASRKYFLFVWAFSADSPCYGVNPGYRQTSTAAYQARFDGLRSC